MNESGKPNTKGTADGGAQGNATKQARWKNPKLPTKSVTTGPATGARREEQKNVFQTSQSRSTKLRGGTN